ncbi:MAG: hypothetical protein FWE80_10160 [Oscillospiraceae bacterium]|nr:hypothetical protein [Oscillospiraceae bacterium]
MDTQNTGGIHPLDEYIEDAPAPPRESSPPPPSYYPANPYIPVPPWVTVQKRDPAVVALLSAILLVALTILSIQIFRPFDRTDTGGPAGNSGWSQDGGSPGSNPYFRGGSPDNGGPQTYENPDDSWPFGNYPGGGQDRENPYSYRNPGGPGTGGDSGDFMVRRGADGRMEWSTDGGETWNSEPPH